IFGDVQRLSNGNTLVVFSTQGVIQEIGPDKSLLRQLSGGTGQAMGYVTERATLYGPPPF
ncbi:MAG TPA: hypothetical protein VMI54_17775, partial [Polyangiaceae bacterium]|nr:hypothetical protein [Polyangiaceae bacterium]